LEKHLYNSKENFHSRARKRYKILRHQGNNKTLIKTDGFTEANWSQGKDCTSIHEWHFVVSLSRIALVLEASPAENKGARRGPTERSGTRAADAGAAGREDGLGVPLGWRRRGRVCCLPGGPKGTQRGQPRGFRGRDVTPCCCGSLHPLHRSETGLQSFCCLDLGSSPEKRTRVCSFIAFSSWLGLDKQAGLWLTAPASRQRAARDAAESSSHPLAKEPVRKMQIHQRAGIR